LLIQENGACWAQILPNYPEKEEDAGADSGKGINWG
jgi:hypothetical protein